VTTASQKVGVEYWNLIKKLGNELDILIKVPRADLNKVALPAVAQGILQVREGKVHIDPGYDGVYGRVRLTPAKGKAKPIKQEVLF
jgi:PHP family Zn ribbon phosphoesterase